MTKVTTASMAGEKLEAVRMIILGVLLILFAVGAVTVAVTAPSATAQVIEVSALGFKVLASPLTMFLAGALSVVALGIGFALVSGGTRRKARSRKELRELRKDQATAGAGPSADPGNGSSRRERLHDERPHDGTESDPSRTGSSGGQTERNTGSSQ